MRGICFKEQLFDLTVNGRKTVTRRMADRYKVGETLYLKEPYFVNADGSIFQFLLVRLKVNTYERCLYDSRKFQFLLVRLKDTVNDFRTFAVMISIPSGTIKRKIKIMKKDYTREFQFLLVRLKALNFKRCATALSNFNSFWYD